MHEFQKNVQLSELNISILCLSGIKNSWVHRVQPKLAQMVETSGSTKAADLETKEHMPHEFAPQETLAQATNQIGVPRGDAQINLHRVRHTH